MSIAPDRARAVRRFAIAGKWFGWKDTGKARRMWSTATTIALATAALLASRVGAQNAALPAYLMDVVRYNAPFIIGENSGNFALDQLLSVDLDGDLSSANNQQAAFIGSNVDRRPTVYFSITETGPAGGPGYYLIGYYFYHVLDGGFSAYGGWLSDPGHLNDLEGMFLVVQKGLGWPYGLPVYAFTEAHGVLVPFFNYRWGAPSSPIFGFSGEIVTWNNPHSGHDHPVVAIRDSRLVALYVHGSGLFHRCTRRSILG
jgi:hypothetical protein